MRQLYMDGLLFTGEELVVLLDAVKAPPLIGIDTNVLLPATPDGYRTMLLEGIQQLQARNLLRIEDGVHVLERDLVVMAAAVAYPQWVAIAIKEVPEKGQQAFVYYTAEGVLVEHTMPAPGVYRLATLPSAALWLERLGFIFPVDTAAVPLPGFQMPRQMLAALQQAVLSGNAHTIARTVPATADPASVATFIEAIETVRFSGGIAFLQMATPPTVAATTEIALIQGDTAWLMEPEVHRNETITVRPVSAAELQAALITQSESLAQPHTA